MIDIYTDGSSIGNPGPGGWGAIIVKDGKETILSGGMSETTNNRMELLAVIESLHHFLGRDSNVGNVESELTDGGGIGLFSSRIDHIEKVDASITIYTDSQYVQKGVGERLATRVRRNRRLSKGGKTIKNVDLWQQLHALLPYFPSLSWQWVKGHAGHEMNERVDDLARGEAMSRRR